MRDLINASLKNWRLPIPPALKRDFLHYQYRQNANFMLLITVIGHLAFYSYAIADYLLVPEIFDRSITLRTIFIGILLPLNIYLIRKVRNITFLEIVFSASLMLATVLWLGVLLPRTQSDVVHTYVYASIIFVVVLNIVIRSNYWLAVFISLLHTIVTLYFVYLLDHGDREAIFIYSIVYLPVLYFSLFISWHNTRTARRLFLLSLIEEQDKSELEEANRKLTVLSHTDALTGVPNRSLFDDRLQQAIAKARRDKTRLALLFIDLDQFKQVNDSHGHAAGDLLLQQVTKHMVDCVRESDTVARIGGDEFEILLPTIESPQDALVVASKIHGVLTKRFKLDGIEVDISASIGVAIFPEHGTEPVELSRNADIALYRAKELGRDRVEMAV
jgi:diguanylate cyclase (GGDEF)-like protein